MLMYPVKYSAELGLLSHNIGIFFSFEIPNELNGSITIDILLYGILGVTPI